MSTGPGRTGLLLFFSLFCFTCQSEQEEPASSQEEASSQPPNIVLIVSDDAGYADFGVYGDPEFATPEIDSIGERGVRFTQGYVSASVCSPSRAGLMTGRYQQRFGHEFNLIDEDLGLPTSEKTMASYLQDLGYRTGLVGKWHLGKSEKYHPLSRGFDEFVGMLAGWKSYFPFKEPQRFDVRLMRQREVVELPEPFEYYTDFLGREASSFIERNQGAPFFLYLAFNAPHTPMEAREDDLDRYPEIENETRRTYAAMTHALDRAVGEVLETLRRLELEQDSLVLFLNDNGGATNNASDNGLLRGMKGSKWEGGIRVPFLMQWPGRLSAGRTYDQPVISLDLLPTVLAAAGGSIPEDRVLDGVDLLPYLEGDRTEGPHETLFWRRGVAAAIRRGPWKAIRVETLSPHLFNLDQDPGETSDLSEKEPEILKELLGALETWEQGLTEPLWREAEKWKLNQIEKHRMSVVGRELERRYP